jgi:NAD-dependent SIR2 family protein deacetylase
MADLSSIEKSKFEKLFDMNTGYVIDFSNRTLSEFIRENTGVEIYDSKYSYASGSKANRLRAFWQIETNQLVGQLLLNLLEYWMTKKEIYNTEITVSERALYDQCVKIAERLTQDLSVNEEKAVEKISVSGNNELNVYISCSRKDQAIAKQIGSTLTSNRIKYWYTLRGPMLPVEQIRAVEEAIEKCQVVVLLLTSNYVQDTFCQSDINKAQSAGKPFIVFSVENINFPETLNSVYKQTYDKKTTSVIPISAWEQSLDKSIETLIQIILVSLEQTEEQIQFNSTLELDYYINRQSVAVTPQRNLKVFLCHASGDKPAVEGFYNTLVNDGIDAWLDKKNLIPGQSWQYEIPKAVKSSDVVIVFLSSLSVTKEGFVQKEIRIALDTADEKPEGTIFIIPARLENCEVPERLARFQWVDLFEEDGYERLYKALLLRAKSLGIVVDRKTNPLPR